MNAPKRLMESNDAAMRELLLAGARERPRPRALQSAALALGVSSSVMAGSATATATLASASVSGATLSQSVGLLAAKWVALGALGGVVLSGGAWVMSSPGSAPPAPSAVQVAVTERAAPNVARAPRASLAEQPSASEIEPQVAEVAQAPRGADKSARVKTPVVESSPAPASANLPASQSLSREIAMIDGARRALAANRAADALRQLDAYATRSRTGTLDREAQLLRIDALTQLGQRAPALTLAQRYLGTYPNDPHAARLRALIGAK